MAALKMASMIKITVYRRYTNLYSFVFCCTGL